MSLFIKLFLVAALFPIDMFGQRFKDFSFIYTFQHNVFDSKNASFTKDMVADSSITFTIKFSKKELKSVFLKLQEIDFWSYPERYQYEQADPINGSSVFIEPCSNYSMNAHSASKYTLVEWSNCESGDKSKGLRYEKLMELNKLIYGIISKKKAYKNSPEPTSGYL